jgi:Protein of unknown function (DUF433)
VSAALTGLDILASCESSLELSETLGKTRGCLMSSQILYPHIEKLENQPARLQRLPRIRVAQIVMDYLAHGWSVEEMCRQHSYLHPSEIYVAMGYYFDHQNEIDQEIQAEWEHVQNQKSQAPSPFAVRLRAKGLL